MLRVVKKPKYGTRPDITLQIMLMAGELPRSLYPVIQYPSTNISTIYNLFGRFEGLVRLWTDENNPGEKAWRLDASNQNLAFIEKAYGRDLIEEAISATSGFSYKKWGIQRRQRTAETMFMAHHAGYPVVMYRAAGEKSLREKAGDMWFSSRFIKGDYGNGVANMKYWRFTGMITRAGTPYVLYSTGDALMKWSAESELRCSNVLMRAAKRYDIHCSGNPNDKIDDAIVFGYGETDIPYKYLTETKNHTLLTLRSGLRCYRNLYYVPMNANGIRQLQIQLEPDWRMAMTMGFKNLSAVHSREACGYDAIDAEGRKVFYFTDGNLNAYGRYMNLTIDDSERHIVVWSWQGPLMNRLLDKRSIRVTMIDMDLWSEF